MGGKQNVLVATSLTFAFVAVWHDAEAELLIWGASNAVFIYLETLVVALVRKHAQLLNKLRPSAHRLLSGCGAATRIIMLMAVNMLGYAVGVGGLFGFFAKMSTTEVRWELLNVLVATYVILYCGAQVMFEIRRVEATDTPRHEHTH